MASVDAFPAGEGSPVNLSVLCHDVRYTFGSRRRPFMGTSPR